MNVLITGAHGFLGRFIAKEYKRNGNYVVGIGHGSWNREDYIKWGLSEWHEATISISSICQIKLKFDLIIHCGGSGVVGSSWHDPYIDFQRSVQSTISVLEFIRLYNPACKFIYPSSPAVQGDLGKIMIKEEFKNKPISPYGFHKKIAEDLCISYNANFGLKIGIIRLFSIYGPGLKKQLLWDACQRIMKEKQPEFHGTGNETRDWLYVTDAASLFYILGEHLTDFIIINGGSGVAHPLYEVLGKVSFLLGKSKSASFNNVVRQGDPQHYWADISKAIALNWHPKIDLHQGLCNYVEFAKNELNFY